jgi:O-succinylbenzoate synthase
MARLTQRELRAINEALSARLAGEIEPLDGISAEDYETAKAKIEARINWKADE